MQSFQEEDYTKRFDLSLWKKIIRLAKPYHKNLLLTILYMAVCAVIDVIHPRMTGYVEPAADDPVPGRLRGDRRDPSPHDWLCHGYLHRR